MNSLNYSGGGYKAVIKGIFFVNYLPFNWDWMTCYGVLLLLSGLSKERMLEILDIETLENYRG